MKTVYHSLWLLVSLTVQTVLKALTTFSHLAYSQRHKPQAGVFFLVCTSLFVTRLLLYTEDHRSIRC